MTIALSSDFLLAFSNVQKGQQKQVREFIERFRERPDGPGMNYELIQSAKGKDNGYEQNYQTQRNLAHKKYGSYVQNAKQAQPVPQKSEKRLRAASIPTRS